MTKQIQPTGVLENAALAQMRVLDMIGLGFISRIFTAIDTYMFGFVNLLSNIFSPMMTAGTGSTDLSYMVFGGFKAIIMVGYVVAAWTIWTGRNIMG
jgi:hypothetical protein